MPPRRRTVEQALAVARHAKQESGILPRWSRASYLDSASSGWQRLSVAKRDFWRQKPMNGWFAIAWPASGRRAQPLRDHAKKQAVEGSRRGRNLARLGFRHDAFYTFVYYTIGRANQEAVRENGNLFTGPRECRPRSAYVAEDGPPPCQAPRRDRLTPWPMRATAYGTGST